jgi:2-polyprenyl-6-methoxyphenol hydroxylase-like FAD-dependent oxidoreductase
VIDVLVAGGGPAGLATAIGCALAGLSVTVAEPRPGPVDKACGEGVMPAALRRLAALGVMPEGYPLRGIRYLDQRHRADARFRHGDGRGVRRTVLQAALAARAAALGIPVLPVRVTTVEQQSGHVTAAGLEARYLVAADGLHSPVRRALERGPYPPRPRLGPSLHASALPRPGLLLRSPPPDRAGPLPRYGLRRHYHVPPWTDLVEVYWAAGAEAYVTPVSGTEVGVAVLFDRPQDGKLQDGGSAGRGGAFEDRLAAFPALRERLSVALPASAVRGAGPLRQDVRRRVYGRVLLVGDASGYLDALTGEGLGVGLAQAGALASGLAAGRPDDYERAWRQVSGPAWRLTAGLLWSRRQPLLGPHIVPAAAHLPRLFSALVNYAAQA